jgi:hypothetical protein
VIEVWKGVICHLDPLGPLWCFFFTGFLFSYRFFYYINLIDFLSCKYYFNLGRFIKTLQFRSGSSSDTPEQARRALRELERATRELDSLSRRRIPATNASRSTFSSSDLITSNQQIDAPSTFTSYSHLPVHLRAQLAALPPLLNPVQRPRHVNQRVDRRAQTHSTSTPLQIQTAVFSFSVPSPPPPQTPAQLQAQAANLPPLLNPPPPPPTPQTSAQLQAQAANLPPLPPQVRKHISNLLRHLMLIITL